MSKKGTPPLAGKVSHAGSQTVDAVYKQPKGKRGGQVIKGNDLRTGK